MLGLQGVFPAMPDIIFAGGVPPDSRHGISITQIRDGDPGMINAYIWQVNKVATVG
jgi:hypothetical protein